MELELTMEYQESSANRSFITSPDLQSTEDVFRAGGYEWSKKLECSNVGTFY